MRITLGWLCAMLVLSMPGAYCQGQDTAATGAKTESSTEKEKGYQFDPARFSVAMDRASGIPDHSEEGKVVLSTSNTGLSKILGRTVLSLIIVIGAIYGFTYFLKNLSSKTGLQHTGPLRVLAKQRLSQKSSLYVVSTLNRFLVIGETAQGLTCLSEFKDPAEVEKLKVEWGWDSNPPGDPYSKRSPGRSMFAPTLKSHIDDLERELETYGEARS